jgi:tetratricopeptide (TPR) repeat protein
MIQLVLLIVVAVAAFLVTRALAANNREMSLSDAAVWFQRGQSEMSAGHLDEAVDALRRATVRNRTDRTYVLGLAHALALKGDTEAARGELLTLRETAPEDSEINLELARLAASRVDVTEAVRFYHNALYAPWAADQSEARRRVRLELVRFLLTHGQPARAASELVALSTDLPDDVTHHIELARFFEQANDYVRALQQYQAALRLDPDADDALAGAGQNAFQVGDYALARGYLKRTSSESAGIRDTRDVLDLTLSRDPLAARIGSAERRRRLLANLEHAQERLSGCVSRHQGTPATVDEIGLQNEATGLDAQLRSGGALDQDGIEAGVELIDRIERSVVQSCSPATTLDRALLLIGRRHGAESQ